MSSVIFYILSALILTGCITYFVFCIRFWNGYRTYKPTFNYKKRTVSVVIAARNEAKNLQELLLCLLNQDYPKELFEVILADDDSEDDTEQVAKKYIDAGLNLHYLKVLGRENVISPKKKAMEDAVYATQGEIILTTDADCLVPETWISSMVSMFTDDVSMVAGYSRTYIPDWKKASLVQKYEHLDFALTYMVLAGGYTIGKKWACIGQNLAYRRTAFDDVGGFTKIKHLLSGDDVNLLQLMRNKGHKIIFNFLPSSFVYTHPVTSWKQLINQRSRWASNMKYQLKFNPEFFFILLSMAFMYWGGLIMLFFNIKIALIIFLYRIIVENITISYSRSRFGFTKEMLRFYPIWLVIQNFFLVLTMVLGQFNIFVWKGKRPTSRRNNNANHNI
ncbi:MAG: glycosyltransferase [Candidatus Cloacimonetes bacterium]|nr:glycosyltransferase [Candidatus Cloacimonadota bacterium]